jgi:Ca2+/Na+ antiporter
MILVVKEENINKTNASVIVGFSEIIVKKALKKYTHHNILFSLEYSVLYLPTHLLYLFVKFTYN